ncbi:MAG TPA: hypothetical protein DDZ51_12195, partial [Planctomycetaceae bacterium]|nr:hypothetical protein [Planctomycetaceae bacterium]
MYSIEMVGSEEKSTDDAVQLTALQTLREAVCHQAKCLPGAPDALHDPIRNAVAIELACYWEATAPKVGNVHPGAAFADCCYEDFCRAAKSIAPILAGADKIGGSIDGIGQRVLRSIEATRKATAANVNLGIVLLIAPLASARDRGDIARVLSTIDRHQTELVYRAIGLAAPGGVKPAEVDSQWDVTSKSKASPARDHHAQTESLDLIAAMR